MSLLLFSLFSTCFLGAASVSGQEAGAAAAETLLRVRVLDFQTGEPIARAWISLPELGLQGVTEEDGTCFFQEVPAGEYELLVSTVGYGLLKKRLQLAPPRVDLEIRLGQEVLPPSEEITVSTGPFDSVEPPGVPEYTLSPSELRNLGSVLAADPLRSVQALPGVTTGDDFYAQFSLRGSGFRNVGFYLDGVSVPAPFHTVQDVQDGGSLSTLSGDLIETVSLVSSAAPARYGNLTSGVLSIRTREGNRERLRHRGSLSAAGMSYTAEGPLRGEASWLVSARKSYLDWLIQRVSADVASSLIFGFRDLQGKLSWRPREDHELHLFALAGDSRVDRSRESRRLGVNSFLTGDQHSRLVILNWRWLPSGRTLLQSLGHWSETVGENRNPFQKILFRSNFRQMGIQQDLSQELGRGHRLEAGFRIHELRQEETRRRFDFRRGVFFPLFPFSARGLQPGAYVQASWALPARLTLTAGSRWDRFSETGQTVWTPRASLSLALPADSLLTAACGRYTQFPEFVHLEGEFGNPRLRAEESTHALIALERLFTERVRLRVEAYQQWHRRGFFSAGTEYRTRGGRVLAPSPGSVLENSLWGRSRGVEIVLQRRSANGVSGWVAYGYASTRFEDRRLGLHFPGDFDQRHTLNLYASRRLTETLNLSARYRYGSNFPIVGFYRRQQGRFFLGEEKNRLRVPPYHRLDLRLNQAFHFDRWKLTLYVEILNLLGRENVRYPDFDRIQLSTGEVVLNRDTLLPFLPVAGLTVEF